MALKHASSYAQGLQKIVNRYRSEVHAGPLDLLEISHWAIQKGLWEAPRRDRAKILQRDLSRALREEYYTDPQGRVVRRKHAYRIAKGEEQLTLWVDIEDASPKQMHLALQQRRRSILGDCRQLRRDTDSFNDNNKFGAQIQMSFNFQEDLDELEQPTEYLGVGLRARKSDLID